MSNQLVTPLTRGQRHLRYRPRHADNKTPSPPPQAGQNSLGPLTLFYISNILYKRSLLLTTQRACNIGSHLPPRPPIPYLGPVPTLVPRG